MKIKIIILCLCGIALFSCEKEADISIFNNLSNVRLDNISYCNKYIGSHILPGETGKTTIHESDQQKFPLIGRLEFTLVSGDEQVFLQTKESYTLSEGETLSINIDENTEVINPQKEVLKISGF